MMDRPATDEDDAIGEAITAGRARRHIQFAYGLLAISLLSGVVPDAWSSLAALLSFAAAPYAARRAAKILRSDYTESHAIFIRRSVWISTLIAAVTTSVAGWYLAGHDDIGPLQGCADRLLGISAAGTPDASLLALCFQPFLAANRRPLLVSAVIAGLPFFLYLLIRIVRGGGSAWRGQPVARPRGWL